MTMGDTIRDHLLSRAGITSVEATIGSQVLDVVLRNCYLPHDGPHAKEGDSGWAHRPMVVVMHNTPLPPTPVDPTNRIVIRILAVPFNHHTDVRLYSSWKYIAAHNGVAYFEVTL